MSKKAKKVYRRKYRMGWYLWDGVAKGPYEIWKHGPIGHPKPLTGSERRQKKREELNK